MYQLKDFGRNDLLIFYLCNYICPVFWKVKCFKWQEWTIFFLFLPSFWISKMRLLWNFVRNSHTICHEVSSGSVEKAWNLQISFSFAINPNLWKRFTPSSNSHREVNRLKLLPMFISFEKEAHSLRQNSAWCFSLRTAKILMQVTGPPFLTKPHARRTFVWQSVPPDNELIKFWVKPSNPHPTADLLQAMTHLLEKDNLMRSVSQKLCFKICRSLLAALSICAENLLIIKFTVARGGAIEKFNHTFSLWKFYDYEEAP